MRPVAVAIAALLCACQPIESADPVESEFLPESGSPRDGSPNEDENFLTEEAEAGEPLPAAATIPANIAASTAGARRTQRLREGRLPVPTDRDELRARTIEALLRVAISEEGWANEIGMKAIWQVARATRGCLDENNVHVSCRDPRSTRRRAPPLAGLWRNSPRATGNLPPVGRRGAWVRSITVDCEQPTEWPKRTRRGSPYAQWVSYQGHCEDLVRAAEAIVDGKDHIQACPSGSRPIAWGCDPERRRAIREVLGRNRPVNGCNDSPIARRRQLQRLDCGETENAYWCRPGTPHCGTLPASERALRSLDPEEGGSEDRAEGENSTDTGLTQEVMSS